MKTWIWLITLSVLTCLASSQVLQCQTNLTNGDKHLIVSCLFPSTIPKDKSCELRRKLNNIELSTKRSARLQATETNFKCDFNLSVSALGAGAHEFYAVVPSDAGTALQSSSATVNFTKPEVTLSNDCFIPWSRMDNCLVRSEGYCTCIMVSPGYPTGSISWVKSNGMPANQPQSTFWMSKLVVTAPVQPSHVKNETFNCVWESPLGKQKAHQFYVIYPVGPTSMNLKIDGIKETFDLCPGKPTNLTAVCEVPKRDVFPSPWFHFTINGSIPVYNWYLGQLDKGVYRYNTTVNLDKAGNFSIFCWPANSCSRSVSATQKTLSIQIREPPSSPPVMTINDKAYNGSSDVIDVTDGTKIAVTCHVPGGVPAVNDVTVNCDALKKTMKGDSVQLPDFTARKSSNGRLCTCRASHLTRCYDKQTSVRLNISG